MKRVAGLAALVAVLLAATALPFLPGGYDALAVPLSMTARCFGLASLLLVPIGLAWLVYESSGSREGVRRGGTGLDRPHWVLLSFD